MRSKRTCPVCGRTYTEPPAISRRSKCIEICPECGMREAIEDWNRDQEERTETHARDTIYRQVAIDAVDTIGHIATMPDGDKCIRRSAVKYTLSMLPPAQPDVPDTNVGGIDKFIDGLEEIFADLRERHVDNSVCGLCEYDGAYIGQSGDWCNECPGFERDDCFKLSDKTRKKWTEEIIKALLTAQPQQKWIPVSERLPELDEDGYSQKVLACFGNCSGCDILEYRATEGIGKWYIGDMDDSPEDIGVMVLAWMPLPEPYKGVER